MQVTFLRHGQTPCGVANVYCGQCPAELTPAGHAMAQAFAQAHAHIPWQAIAVSPLRRAQQTAAPLAQRLGLTPLTVDSFAELHYGVWDGRSADSLQTEPQYPAWHANPAAHAPPGGETGAAVAQRALAALQQLRTQQAAGPLLVVSHKATLRLLICALLGIPLADFRRRLAQPLGGVSQIDFLSTGPLLRRLGDISYLPDALRNLPGS